MANTKKHIKITAFALLCVLFLIYVIYHIANTFKDETQLFLVSSVTEEHTLDVTGYIFRDETVVYAAASGFCAYSRENGEKVSKDSVIASSYFVKNEELEKKLNDLNYKIEVLAQCDDGDSLAALDARIEELRQEIALKSASGNASFAGSAEKELLVLLHERTLVEKNGGDFSAELTALRAERTLLLSALATAEKTVTAEESGYFYSYVDGYEGIFTAEAAKNMTIDSFRSLTSSNALEISGAIGKIATTYKWYFVCETTTEASEEIVADKYYDVAFTDNSYDEKLNLFVENKIVDYSTGEVVLVFSCTTLPQNFDFSRFQRAKVTLSEIEGLRIPTSSVRMIDGEPSVYIMKEGVCRVRKVNILFEKDGYYIVSADGGSEYISKYDRIIIGDSALYDGKVVGY